MKMSAVVWFIPRMRKYSCTKKTIYVYIYTSMSADGNGSWWRCWRVSLDKQLTEREWRRPLIWLDRFRDAVLLPASWGDEHIQPHVRNKCCKYVNQHILATEASTWDTGWIRWEFQWTYSFRFFCSNRIIACQFWNLSLCQFQLSF